MKPIILISILAVAYCMPHNLNPSGISKPAVEIEKQVVVELTPSTRVSQGSPKREEIDKATREILAKIEQVNIKQGYVAKNSGAKTVSELPHYYLYSYQQPKPVGKYIYDMPQTGVANSEKNTQADHTHDHYPKRKVSQQQMYLIPVGNFAPPQLIVTPTAELPKFYYDIEAVQNSNDDLRDVLQRKTVDNIKDIVVKSQSQLLPNVFSSTYFNPLVQNLPYYVPPIYGYPTENLPPTIMLNSVTTTIEEYDTTNCNSEKRFGKELNPGPDFEVHLDYFGTTKNRTEKEVQEKSKQRPHKPILVLHHPQQNDDEYLKPELEDEAETEAESDKTVETNDKKFFSKDNIGDGIFIRRLKVRKGGVAIAGPGGIATAGSGGTAIVGPNGWAYTHPDSLAIAGSGTKVIAVDPNIKLGDLIKPNVTRKGALNTRIGKVVAVGPVIYYNRGDSEKPVKVTHLPFYGGAKGQTLQIIEKPDGTVTTQIIASPSPSTEIPMEKVTNLTALEYPQLPTKYESEYGFNIKNIHHTALNIIKLQETAKNRGSLNDDEQLEYGRNMDSLNLSAKNLAQLQDTEDEIEADDEGLMAWFDRQKKREEIKKKEEEEKKKKKEEDKKKKEEDKKKQEAEKEKEKEEEEEEDDISDSVIVNLPPDDASVAEAKPVGLAVAGVGGVAASKPIATAVVGPGGLAVARPVGTAIAGVAPDQALVPIFAEAYVKPSKKKEPSKEGKPKQGQSTELLNRIIAKYHEV